MLDVLGITGAIYLGIALGFAGTRFGVFRRADMRVLGKFALNVALPALLFDALAKRPIAEIVNASYLVAYLGGSLAVAAAGYAWCRRVAGLDRTTSGVYTMGMTCSNSGFIGYPIVLLTFAPVAGVALALNMVAENFVMIPLMLLLAERGRGDAGPWHVVLGRSFRRMAGNPLIIGLAGGMAVSLVGWQLPAPVARAVQMFAVSSSALSLFAIGGTLVGLPLRGHAPQVLPIAFAKLVLHPAAVALATVAVPALGLPALDPSLRWAAVLMAAVPMMSMYLVLAQQYQHEDVGATATLVTTIASFATLSALLWFVAAPR